MPKVIAIRDEDRFSCHAQHFGNHPLRFSNMMENSELGNYINRLTCEWKLVTVAGNKHIPTDPFGISLLTHCLNRFNSDEAALRVIGLQFQQMPSCASAYFEI